MTEPETGVETDVPDPTEPAEAPESVPDEDGEDPELPAP